MIDVPAEIRTRYPSNVNQKKISSTPKVKATCSSETLTSAYGVISQETVISSRITSSQPWI
jgi:hypothetical protein